MPKITKIEEQKKHKDRVNLYIDDKFFMGVFKELIYKENIEEDQEVEPDKLKEMIKKETIYKAKEKALQIINRSSQTEKILREKLENRGYDKETIDKVFSWLKDTQYYK